MRFALIITDQMKKKLIDLKYFITEHIIKNNELGSIIADDFNLV